MKPNSYISLKTGSYAFVEMKTGTPLEEHKVAGSLIPMKGNGKDY